MTDQPRDFDRKTQETKMANATYQAVEHEGQIIGRERLHGLIDLWMQVSFWDLVLAGFLVGVIVGSVHGHHLAQNVSNYAVDLLRERWKP